MKRIFVISFLLVITLVVPRVVIEACVGRTIYIGYFPSEPEQVLAAKLLSVFIDERTGTSVKMVELKDRRVAFDYLKREKISILVDYAGNLVDYYGKEKGEKVSLSRFLEVKHDVANFLKAVVVTTPGYDSSVRSGRENLGKAVILLSRRSLSKFPAMPRLLKKLRGVLGNREMRTLVEEAKGAKPEKVARSFLKKNKLI